MFRYLIMKSAAALLIGMCVTTSAWADHQYKITFRTEELLANTSVAINPPKGYYPNSECMSTWAVPTVTKEISQMPGFLLELNLTIKDKDGYACNNAPKYNTWTFEIRRYYQQPKFPGDGDYQVVASGSAMFYHRYSTNYGWGTMIVGQNTDGAPPDKPYVKWAWCKAGDCLNQYIYGKEAADTIDIRISYPNGNSVP